MKLLNQIELATILAALRYYQNCPEIGNADTDIGKIATVDGQHFDADDIDELCEALNCDEPVQQLADLARELACAAKSDTLDHARVLRDTAKHLRSLSKHTLIGDRPQIVVVMEGGLVQEVLANLPADARIIDYDTEGADEDELSKVPQTDGTPDSEAAIHDEVVSVLPRRVAQLHAIKK